MGVFFAHRAPADLAAWSHWAASVPGVFGGKGHGVMMGCTWYSSAFVLARVQLCMWMVVWGWAVLAIGESSIYFHILGVIKKSMPCMEL
eukprot:474554-Pelagomonas_calceolata.AAC.1